MSDDEKDRKTAGLEADVREMEIKAESPSEQSEPNTLEGSEAVKHKLNTANGLSVKHEVKSRSNSQSPIKSQSAAHSPQVKSDDEETIGGEITVKVEPGQAPKLSRKSSQKVVQRPPQLFLDHEDKTEEATSAFEVITDCTYANKYIGTTDHALECECQEEWGTLLRMPLIHPSKLCRY